MKLVLASNSPRRKQILALEGWDFEVDAEEIDESLGIDESALAYVTRLAETKARAAYLKKVLHSTEDTLFLAADTTVVLDADILGKPVDPGEAWQMLDRLRGRSHHVYTALAVLSSLSSRLFSLTCVSEVRMRAYTQEEIDRYVASGDPFDKAGAYAIQHTWFNPVESVQGCYANVAGLPLCQAVDLLVEFGMSKVKNITQACSPAGNSACRVFDVFIGGK